MLNFAKNTAVLLLLLLLISEASSVKLYIASDTLSETSPPVTLLKKLYSPDDDSFIERSPAQDSLLPYLLKTGILLDAHYNSDSTILTLYPGVAIRDIVIRGAFPLFRSEIEKVMSVGSGNFITEKLLKTQKELIRDKLSRSGIINPIITLTPVKLERYPGLVNLRVDIRTSEYRKIKKLTYTGSSEYGLIRHGLKFHHWHYKTFLFLPRRFMQEDLRDDIRSLRNFYRFQGYGDVEVKTADSLLGVSLTNNEQLELKVSISPGIVNRIHLDGVRPLRKKKVRNLFDIYKKGNRNNSTIKRGRVRSRKMLKEMGYASAKININDTVAIRGKRYPWECRYHTISIDKGERIAIDALKIRGNKTVKEKKIRTLMLTREGGIRKRKSRGTFSPRIFKKDIEEIEKYYKSIGFFNADVHGDFKETYPGDTSENEMSRVAVSISVKEGSPCRVKNVLINGIPEEKPEIEDTLRAVMKNHNDSLFVPVAVFNDRIRITSTINRLGYPFAEVKEVENYNSDSTEVSLTYNINPYHSAVTGKIIYWGNFATKEKLLNQKLGITPGSPFSLQKLNEGIRELRNLGLFETVNYSIPSMKHRADTLNIIISVKENKSIELRSAGGYETDMKFYVKGSVLKNNLWGMNKSILLEANYSQVERGGIITFTEPHMFNTNLIGSISLYGKIEEKRNVSYITNLFGNSYTIGYKFRKKLMLSITGAYEAKKNIGVNGTYVDTSNGSETIVTNQLRHTFLITPKISFDGRDSFVRPKKGGIISLSAMISNGLNIPLDDYWKLEGEGKIFLTPVKRITLALRARGGFVRRYGANDYIPADELFLLGGTASVRGFAENNLFYNSDESGRAGLSSFDASIELRPEVASNIEIPLFIDAGTLGFSDDIFDVEPFRYSGGTGIRFITPIGPIGIVYGWKFEYDSETESPGAVHFSIGYTF